MLARLHAIQTTQEQHDLGLEIVRDQLLPWLRESSGFRGLIRLWSPAESKTLVITLWADEESLRSWCAERLAPFKLALEDYEVSFFDVTDA